MLTWSNVGKNNERSLSVEEKVEELHTANRRVVSIYHYYLLGSITQLSKKIIIQSLVT